MGIYYNIENDQLYLFLGNKTFLIDDFDNDTHFIFVYDKKELEKYVYIAEL